ncbi:Predicted arabinose efflux permease, MFS family [Streptomyces sp. TLI_053]|uniref:MFS transporter n=1 Tax=Streptomyces sp. TLI_053 TaxID=1855352 RepID=UPI000879C27D|nr:MFS transporter [Streptomyces sp. TLI_053]SDT81059.1 Predicted arabinose efflux permease, MFS family [Streptomyces sp. TLI_053]
MLSVLRNRTYRHLFVAQVVALAGTGLATVALGLLAYDLAGAEAGSVLGTALAIKMVAYVGIAPVVAALAHRIPRRRLLVAADLARAGVALALPFVGSVWQVYLLIFVLQAASATFTPAFQSVIPDVLPEERDYTRALSLSRLAYDTETLVSPVLAAALLALVGYRWLFWGTVVGFLASAVLVVSVVLPGAVLAARSNRDPVDADDARGVGARSVAARSLAGIRLFLSVPRLRALLALDLAVAAGGAMVIVNTVVYVREELGRSAGDVPLALGAYGGGSMLVALLLPRVLDRVADRTVMLPAAFAVAGLLAVLAAVTTAGGGAWRWPALLALWAGLGAAGSLILTPGGRLLRSAVPPADLPAAFAAQFSLTHVCWLLAYPLAGWLGATAGLPAATVALAVLALVSAVLATRAWRTGATVASPVAGPAAGPVAGPVAITVTVRPHRRQVRRPVHRLPLHAPSGRALVRHHHHRHPAAH